MAERGGFGRGFGGRGGRGGDRGGRGRGGRRPRRETEEEKWVPVTKLGRLVKDGKIRSLEQIYLHSLPIKEYQIIDTLIGPSLKDEATFDCLMKTYGFLTPDFWKETRFTKSPFQEYFDILAKPANKVIVYANEEAAPERVEA
ncbi:40S ribosomal protein [Datura stramonium]|uniref:40S ribosomal protein n=1 Tax=Datura stramonium TaxID=4076 RepID=A0ABS8SLX1_DATST|nr:40S ribosomal protein [Datura stramonium]